MTKRADEPVSNAEVVRSLRGIRRLVMFTIAATGAAVGTQYLVSAEARHHNCDRVQAAFDDYTTALAAAFGRDRDDPAVVEFRAAYEPQLEECR